jgi:hypothetical protein
MAPPKPQPMPVLANPPQRFENQPAGIAFTYPAGWKAGDATAVKFKFDSPGNGPSKPQLTLDVPALPFHFGILPLDQVCSGYVDDAKKTMPDAQVTNLPDPTLPDAKQHRFKLTGHKNGAALINEAVVLVHADKVYILSIDCDDKSYPPAKAALDQAAGSLQWIK